MSSARKPAPVVGRDGLSSSRREQDVSSLEISPIFGRLVGLNDGQKVLQELCREPWHIAVFDRTGRFFVITVLKRRSD